MHAEGANADARIGKGKAQIYSDYQRLIDRKDIDVVSIATPDIDMLKLRLSHFWLVHMFLPQTSQSELGRESINTQCLSKTRQSGILHWDAAAK